MNLLVILICLVVNSTSGLAEPKKERLIKGSKASFTGFLLNDEAAAKLVTEPQKVIDKLKLRIEYLEKRNKDILDYNETMTELHIQAGKDRCLAIEESKKVQKIIYEGIIANANKRIEELKPKWYTPYIQIGGVAAAFIGGWYGGANANWSN